MKNLVLVAQILEKGIQMLFNLAMSFIESKGRVGFGRRHKIALNLLVMVNKINKED